MTKRRKCKLIHKACSFYQNKVLPILSVIKNVAHLMIMIWNESFLPSFTDCYAGDVSKIQKVDYAKYIAGISEYICQNSELTPVIYDPTSIYGDSQAIIQ